MALGFQGSKNMGLGSTCHPVFHWHTKYSASTTKVDAGVMTLEGVAMAATLAQAAYASA